MSIRRSPRRALQDQTVEVTIDPNNWELSRSLGERRVAAAVNAEFDRDFADRRSDRDAFQAWVTHLNNGGGMVGNPNFLELLREYRALNAAFLDTLGPVLHPARQDARGGCVSVPGCSCRQE